MQGLIKDKVKRKHAKIVIIKNFGDFDVDDTCVITMIGQRSSP